MSQAGQEVRSVYSCIKGDRFFRVVGKTETEITSSRLLPRRMRLARHSAIRPRRLVVGIDDGHTCASLDDCDTPPSIPPSPDP